MIMGYCRIFVNWVTEGMQENSEIQDNYTEDITVTLVGWHYWFLVFSK